MYVCFPTWGVLLLTQSVLGRMSSHMIIHRARVCEKQIVVRLENWEPLQLTEEGHTNPQQQKLGLDEIQQEPGVWRFQPISNGPGGQKQEERRGGVNVPSSLALSANRKTMSELRMRAGGNLLTNRRSTAAGSTLELGKGG